MFNGMLCPVHQDARERIVDADFRTMVEEHLNTSVMNLADMDTDYSIIELMSARIQHWLIAARSIASRHFH
jgi:hypothetical protein